MDENPYKSPESEGAPRPRARRWRIGARLILLALGTPLAFSTCLSAIVAVTEFDPSAWMRAIITGTIATVLFYAASRIPISA
jgi:hypothetical protein